MEKPLRKTSSQFERIFLDAGLTERQKQIKKRQQWRGLLLSVPLLVLGTCFIGMNFHFLSAFCYFAAGTGIMLHALICIREGAVLFRLSFTIKRESPAMFWIDISVFFLMAAALAVLAVFIALHQNAQG